MCYLCFSTTVVKERRGFVSLLSLLTDKKVQMMYVMWPGKFPGEETGDRGRKEKKNNNKKPHSNPETLDLGIYSLAVTYGYYHWRELPQV